MERCLQRYVPGKQADMHTRICRLVEAGNNILMLCGEIKTLQHELFDAIDGVTRRRCKNISVKNILFLGNVFYHSIQQLLF